MADISFTKKTLQDLVDACAASLFQRYEDALDKITHLANRGGAILDADTVGGTSGAALWYSSSGTGGSDGNAGQPPAPKTYKQSASLAQNAYSAITTAQGGTFLVWVWNASTGGIGASAIIINSGNTAYLLGTLSTSTLCSIVLSGADVRFTNLNAATNVLYFGLTQIGW